MKKLLVFVLIALCCLSVFAADMSATVKVNFGVNETGWGFKEGASSLGYAFTSDDKGAKCYLDYVIKPEYNWNGFGLHLEYWAKPSDSVTVTTGAQSFVNFNDLKATEFLFFVRPVLDLGAAGGYYFAEVGYSSSVFDFSKKNYYAFGEAKVFKNKIDVAALANFTFENGKFDVSLFNAEAAYLPSYELRVNWNKVIDKKYGVPGLTGMNQAWIPANLVWYISDSEYLFGTDYTKFNTEQRKVALRYKYAEDNAPEANGVFAFVEARNHKVTDTTSFTAIFEIGRYGVDTEVGVMMMDSDEYTEFFKADANFAMKVVDGEFGVDVSFAGVKFYDSKFGTYLKTTPWNTLMANGYLQLDYFNSADRAERDNGLFLTGFTTGKLLQDGEAPSPSVKVGLTKLGNSPKFVYDFNLNGAYYF